MCGFLFLLNNFPLQSLEYATYSSRIAAKNRRRVELSSSVLLQTLGKLKSLQDRDFSSSCDSFIRIVLNFNFEFKVLTAA